MNRERTVVCHRGWSYAGGRSKYANKIGKRYTARRYRHYYDKLIRKVISEVLAPSPNG